MKKFVKGMKLKALDIEAGEFIAIMRPKDARELGLIALDRVEIKNPENGKSIVCVLDLTDSMVKENWIGVFGDVTKKIKAKNRQKVEVSASPQPETVSFIRKKIDGKELNSQEIREIVEDVAENRLSTIEESAFMSAVYIRGFTLNETVAMGKALLANGQKISLAEKGIVDKHSIGGINGRATMIIVPIAAAAGLFVPKTSSRSITSAGGTADAMEVLAPVNLSLRQIKKITKKIGGVIAWGGALDLAPVDDEIIKIEHPLSLNPKGQIIASVLAKKASVGSKVLVVDIPIGPGVKVKSQREGNEMAKRFREAGKKMGIKVKVILTDARKPSGPAFGPALEARHVMEILEGKVFDNLAEKSCRLAGEMLELSGKARKGKGYGKAKEILENGKALEKMREIIKAQGGKIFSSKKVMLSKKRKKIKSKKEGKVKGMDLEALRKTARMAGAPADKKAGIMLKVKPEKKVKKGSVLLEIHAENERKLGLAEKFFRNSNAIRISR